MVFFWPLSLYFVTISARTDTHHDSLIRAQAVFFCSLQERSMWQCAFQMCFSKNLLTKWGYVRLQILDISGWLNPHWTAWDLPVLLQLSMNACFVDLFTARMDKHHSVLFSSGLFQSWGWRKKKRNSLFVSPKIQNCSCIFEDLWWFIVFFTVLHSLKGHQWVLIILGIMSSAISI